MEEYHGIGLLCRVLNRWDDRPEDFLPETTGGVPGLAVFSQASADPVKKRYIDGRCVCTLPFAIRYTVGGAVPAEKADALAFFDRCTAYLRTHMPTAADFVCDAIRQVSTPAKTAVWEDGTVEYAVQYVMEYRTI